jgi:hypothetical protein
MGGMRARARLRDHRHRGADRGGDLALDGGDQYVTHGAAGHVLHRDERRAVLVLRELEDVHHVWVADQRDEARLREEHLDERVVHGEVRQDALDDDEALEPRHAAFAAHEDLGHAADREAIEHVVFPKPARQGRCWHLPCVRLALRDGHSGIVSGGAPAAEYSPLDERPGPGGAGIRSARGAAPGHAGGRPPFSSRGSGPWRDRA